MKSIDLIMQETGVKIARRNAEEKAKAARMAFAENANRVDASLKAIVNRNQAQITRNGSAGAYQLFAARYSASNYKRAAAQNLLNSRRAIRFHKIYNNKDVSKSDWAFKALDYTAQQRRIAGEV